MQRNIRVGLVGLLVVLLVLVPLMAACAEPKPAPSPVASPKSSPSPVSKQEVRLSLWTSPLGTGIYAMGTAAEKIVNKYQPYIRITATETQGTAPNVQRLTDSPELWKTAVIGADTAVITMAKKAMSPFKTTIVGIKELFGLTNAGSCLVTFDPNLKTLENVKGKKIGLGRITQTNYGLFPTMAMKAAGVFDNLDVKYLDSAAAVQALIDGVVDAAIVGMYFDAATMEEIVPSPEYVSLQATKKKIYLVGFGKEAINKMVADEFVGYVEIPAGFEGLTAPMPIYLFNACWAVQETFPEELAYELTKVWLQNATVYSEYHNLGKFITPSFGRQALTPGKFSETDIHSGALKAFKEAGIVVTK